MTKKDNITMSIAAASKRRYVVLRADQWREVEALWEAGSATLPELSHTFGVTERTLQAHFAKNGTVKGSAAKALAIEVTARVQAERAADVEDLTVRARQIGDATYAAASKAEKMIVAALDAADADPGQIYAAAAKVKMLANAAAALERLHALKKSALGINNDDMNDAELPVLVLRDLSEARIKEIQRGHDIDDADFADTDDNDVIVEEK